MSEQDADGSAADAGNGPDAPAEDSGGDLEDIAEAPPGDAETAMSAVLGETMAADLDPEDVQPDDELIARVAEAEPEPLARELAALRTRVGALESKLAEREAEAEDLESRLARKQADFQNYKKRQEERLEQEKARATEDLVTRLLDVRDNLQRALDQDEDVEIRGGVESTLRQFEEELERENVQPIEPEPGEAPDGLGVEPGDVAVVEPYRPAHVGGESEDGLHHGGLAGPVRADDGDVLAILDEQVHVFENLKVAVAGVESFDIEECH